MGGVTGKAPPTKGQMLPEVIQVAHPQKNFNQERQRTVVVVVVLADQEVAFISNLLILSTLLVMGEDAGMPQACPRW